MGKSYEETSNCSWNDADAFDCWIFTRNINEFYAINKEILRKNRI